MWTKAFQQEGNLIKFCATMCMEDLGSDMRNAGKKGNLANGMGKSARVVGSVID